MKYNKILSVCTLILILFSSCADVPENIEARDSQLDSIEQAQNDVKKLERGSIDYIREKISEDVSKKYGTITVKNASIGSAKEMPVYRIEVVGNNYTVKELAEYLYEERFDTDNKDYYEFESWDSEGKEPVPYKNDLDPEFDLWSPGVYTDIYSFYPEKETDMTLSCHVFSDGTCWGSQTGINVYGDDYDAFFTEEPVNYYFPEFDDIDDISYKMQDGKEWPLSDAVKFTEGLWNTELSKNDPQKYTYFVRRVDVFKLPDNGNFGYLFTMSYTDEDGNRYECDSYDDYNLEENTVYSGKRFFLSQREWQFSLNKNEITRFDKSYSFKKNKEICNDKEFLTLGSALTVLKEQLADNINIDFDTAELCYIITCDKYPDKDYGGKVKYSDAYARKKCELYLRPYWCFRIGNGFADNWYSAKNYYVDALTGEIKMIMR